MKILTTSLLALCLTMQSLCLEKIADWTSVSTMPNQKYYDVDGKQAPLEQILYNNGFNTVRQSHFVGRSNEHNHEINLILAKRAKAVGLDVYIDLHFRHGYNDPQNIQCDPAWGNTVQSIGKGIYDYTLKVGDSFARHDIIPKYISLGNEIGHGVCGPGNLTLSDGMKNTAFFLHQASKGFRASQLGRRTKLMLHLENGWKTELFEWFFGAVEQAGLPWDAWDVAAMTAYPFYHSVNATQKHFFETIKMVQTKYKKPVLIVETCWPNMYWGKMPANALPPDTNFPVSVEGQTEWIKLLAITAKKAGAIAIGYYEGAWLTNAHTGSNFGNTLLFDDKSGKALPSLATFKTI